MSSSIEPNACFSVQMIAWIRRTLMRAHTSLSSLTLPVYGSDGETYASTRAHSPANKISLQQAPTLTHCLTSNLDTTLTLTQTHTVTSKLELVLRHTHTHEHSHAHTYTVCHRIKNTPNLFCKYCFMSFYVKTLTMITFIDFTLGKLYCYSGSGRKKKICANVL